MTTHPQACQPDPRLCGTKSDEQSSPSREEIEKLLPKNFALTAGAMSKKLVFERQAKTVLSDSQDFAHKLLCTGPTLNLGDACVYSCQYCYVSAMMWRLLAPLLKAVNLSGGPCASVTGLPSGFAPCKIGNPLDTSSYEGLRRPPYSISSPCR